MSVPFAFFITKIHHSDNEDGGRGIGDWNGEDTLLGDIKVLHSTFLKFSMELQWNNPGWALASRFSFLHHFTTGAREKISPYFLYINSNAAEI